VAQGLTNREVAARILLSPHTVSFHLRKVYRKLGIRRRVELTRSFVDRERDRLSRMRSGNGAVAGEVQHAP
jgi:DNA-binding NarL/FixJ family response regulator